MVRPAAALVFALACRPEPRESDSDSGAAQQPFDDDIGMTCSFDWEPLPDPPTPVPSIAFLPTSNGHVAALYALDARGVPVAYADGSSGTTDQQQALVAFFDHLPRTDTAGAPTRDRLWDAYPGLRVDGVTTWLNSVPIAERGYEPGTGIIAIRQTVGPFSVITRWFAPMQDGGGADLDLVVTVENTDDVAHEVALYVLGNAHTGGEGQADSEGVEAHGDGISEVRGGDALLWWPIGGADHRGAAPAGNGANPWVLGTEGSDLSGDTVDGNDVAVGFQWDFPQVAPGEAVTRGAHLALGSDAGVLREHVEDFLGERDAQDVLADELADWEAWHALESPPAGLDADEVATWRQSTAVLRMAQVREEGPAKGQILASLPPGAWNIAWPRDAAYATVALVRTGHLDEARESLRFQLQADAGHYASWLGLDDYLISVCRYDGRGVEESDGAYCPDGSDAGPNIELDDWGLFLWAWSEYAAARPDDALSTGSLDAIRAGVIAPLAAVQDPNNGMLTADSSIWERHWSPCFPNGRQQFSDSTLQVAHGLARFAEVTGDGDAAELAKSYRASLLQLHQDGGPVFVSDDCPALASSPGEICEGCGPWDASVIDLVDHGLVRPQSALARGTVLGLRRHLALGTGLLRNDDGTGSANPYPWYDDQEWVFVDLRLASALAAMGERADAERLLDWTTAQASKNAYLLPELLSDGKYTSEDDADRVRPGVDLGAEYQGAVPMVGFGAGAWLLAVEEIHAPQ